MRDEYGGFSSRDGAHTNSGSHTYVEPSMSTLQNWMFPTYINLTHTYRPHSPLLQASKYIRMYSSMRQKK
jgi:hypothetical protein